MRGLRHWVAAVVLGVGVALSGAALADESDAEGQSLAEALEGLRSGAEALLRGWMDEVEPYLRELEPKGEALAEEMTRSLRELFEPLGGIGAYHPPEILPNGDIILRRRQPTPEDETDPPEADSADTEGEDPFEL